MTRLLRPLLVAFTSAAAAQQAARSNWSGPLLRLQPSSSGVGASLSIDGRPVPPLWIGGCTGIDCAGSGTWASRWGHWNFSVAQAGRAGLPLVEVELPPYEWATLPVTSGVRGVIERTLSNSPTALIVLRLYFDAPDPHARRVHVGDIVRLGDRSLKIDYY